MLMSCRFIRDTDDPRRHQLRVNFLRPLCRRALRMPKVSYIWRYLNVCLLYDIRLRWTFLTQSC